MQRAITEAGQSLESIDDRGIRIEARVATALAVIFAVGSVLTIAWEMASSAANSTEVAMRAAFPRPLITVLLAGGLSAYTLLIAWRVRYTPATGYFSLWAGSAAYVLAWDLYPFMPEANNQVKTFAFLSTYIALMTWPLTFLVFTRHFPQRSSTDEVASITSPPFRLAGEPLPREIHAQEFRGLLAFWAAFIGLYFLTYSAWDPYLLSREFSLWLIMLSAAEGVILMFLGRRRSGAAGKSANFFVSSRSPWLLFIGVLLTLQTIIYIDITINVLPLTAFVTLIVICWVLAFTLAVLRIPRTLAVAPSILVAFIVLTTALAIGMFYLAPMKKNLFYTFFIPWIAACVFCGIRNFFVGYRGAAPVERRRAQWFAAGIVAGLATFTLQQVLANLTVTPFVASPSFFAEVHLYLLVFVACVGVGMFFRGELDPRLLLGNSLAYAIVAGVLLGLFGWLEHDLIHYLALLTPWTAADAAHKIHWLAPTAAGICLHPAKVSSERAVHWLWNHFRRQPRAT